MIVKASNQSLVYISINLFANDSITKVLPSPFSLSLSQYLYSSIKSLQLFRFLFIQNIKVNFAIFIFLSLFLGCIFFRNLFALPLDVIPNIYIYISFLSLSVVLKAFQSSFISNFKVCFLPSLYLIIRNQLSLFLNLFSRPWHMGKYKFNYILYIILKIL